ncbi:hypothetical protein LMG16407_01558 [Pandoraea apista]|nr:hypothetical protein LMG16407_01558 [Pandoraea apista]
MPKSLKDVLLYDILYFAIYRNLATLVARAPAPGRQNAQARKNRPDVAVRTVSPQ